MRCIRDFVKPTNFISHAIFSDFLNILKERFLDKISILYNNRINKLRGVIPMG